MSNLTCDGSENCLDSLPVTMKRNLRIPTGPQKKATPPEATSRPYVVEAFVEPNEPTDASFRGILAAVS